MKVQTYLFFDGRCEEALNFYRDKLGAEIIEMMRFKDAPPAPETPTSDHPAMPQSDAEKVMHATFRLGDIELMATDGMNRGNPKFDGFSLTLSVAEVAETERLFALLSDGGHVQMPLMPSFFSPSFGMVADKFGVTWSIMAEPK